MAVKMCGKAGSYFTVLLKPCL